MNILEEYQKYKNITQAELGSMLNVTQSQVSKLCKNGIDNRTTRTLKKISILLGKSVDEVIEGMKKDSSNDNRTPQDGKEPA